MPGRRPLAGFIRERNGEAGLNYLCAGYLAFFTHVDRSRRLMADLLKRGRYAER